MRRAIVIAAHYPKQARYPNDPAWALDTELLAARLAQHGYQPVRIPPGHGLEGLREELRVAPQSEDTLVYFAGYLLLSTTGEPAILFGGESTQALSVRALLNRVSAQLDHALVVLDVRAGSEVHSAVELSDEVLLERTLSAASDCDVDLLVRLQPWGSASEASGVALYDVLGTLALEPHAVDTVDLAAAFAQADTTVPVRHRAQEKPFVVLPERQYAATSAALTAAPTISIAPGLPLLEPSEPSAPTARLSVPPPKPGRPPPETPEEAPARESRMSGPPPPKPNSLQSSKPPPKPSSSQLSKPPPKPNSLRPSKPPPKPTASATPAVESQGEPEPLRPMPIQPVVAPPPSQPELEPPPPSWSALPSPTDEPELPEDEAELQLLLEALPGDDGAGRAALCESFLEANPRSKVALHGLSQALGNSAQWERLSAAYDRLLSRQAAPDAVVQLCLLQARLSCNQLQDPKRALPAIERATQLEPENVELQLEAAAMYEQLDDIAAASAHYLAAVDTAPLDAEVHRRLFAFFVYAQKPDRAFQSAATLVSLGAANADEVAAYDRHESGALHRPGRPVVSEDWMLGLEPGASDPALTTLLELVSDTALACFQPDRERLASVRSRVQLEDVATSTTMLARSLGWTTQLLSLPRPALYLDEGDAPPAPLPVRDLAWVVGREFGRGQHQAHLVFHWARSLAANLGTARALRLYPAGEGSSALLSACLAATRKPPLVKTREVFDLALALREKLTPRALKSLLGVLDQASPEEWQRRLESFHERVALCSNRAGLLACGDPAIAARALADERPTDPVVSSQLADLFVYAAGDEYAELRVRLGIARAA